MRFTYLLLLALACCTKKQEGLRVAATAVPHAEILEYIAADLKAEGIDLKIIVTEDYNLPNRALAENEVDANFFQHSPFLDSQIDQFHYPIQSYGNIEIEPMGVYSTKISTLKNLQDGAKIALPNDPSNSTRALLLLEKEGLIKLHGPTIHEISLNPKNIQFIEIDAAMLPRTLQDVDAAVINTNYALNANLNPLKDALALESIESPYANILVVRSGEENRPDLIALKKALTSEKMKRYIEQKYKGAIIPASE